MSGLILVGTVGALASGWKAPAPYRRWLLLPLVAFVVIWVTTPTLFWPMINDLYAVAHGKVVLSDAEVVQLVRRWMVYDWMRVAVIGVGFVSSVQAIRVPYLHEA